MYIRLMLLCGLYNCTYDMSLEIINIMDSIAPILHTKLFLVTALITVIYMYFKFVIYGYWKRRGIPHAPPIIPVGNAFPLISGKVSIGNLMRQKYNEGKKYPVYGIYMFHKPILLINDPNVIQLILIKEFNKFCNRGLYFNDKVDTLSLNLFFLPGERWRQLRTKLTPTFTSGKLKQMYPLLLEIGDNLIRVCDQIIKKDNIVEFKDLIGRYTTDSISSIAFGVDCQSLDNGSSEFQKHGIMVFDLPPSKIASAVFAPIILDIFRIPVFNNTITQFFVKTFNDVLEERRRNKITRKDFLNSLMQLLDKGSLDEDKDLKQKDNNNSANGSALGKISLSEAIGQAFIFYLAGFETTSSTITYCLYELALNPEIQEKVQAEIDEFSKRDGGITYEIMSNDMKYLHMVFLETLRKHPSIPFLNRECIEDCDIPNTNFRIEKGTKLLICMNAMHRDPDIFPDPEKFDPFRFTKENIASRQPYTYLPFGDGPRACIGIRFGMLQTKIALIGLLSNYNFSVCEKTSIPVMYARRSFTQTPEYGIYLKTEKRNKSTFLYKNRQ
ncbi:cytochrome P450 6CK10 [Nasonia vitripennis]|uniref:Cytochrome P450 n=1 Tax=Nasonia vitripennis TaxID=7425 RepID=A0A7M6UDK4_NASVI|nr:cytochrome P450 6CK10 [Nasonia vitripennis]